MATIYKRGKIWWIAYRDRFGRRVQKSTGSADKKTAEALKRHYGAIENADRFRGTPLQAPMRFDDFRQEYFRLRSGRVSEKTLARDRQALDTLQTAVKKPTLDRFTNADIERWYSGLLESRAIATANCLLRHVRAFFNTAVRLKYLYESPVTVRPAREIQKSPRVLSRDEVGLLLGILPGPWERLTKAALYTGARAGELCRLVVNDVVLSPSPFVTIRSTTDNPTKSRKSRVVPLPSASVPFFAALTQGRHSGAYLLTNAHRKMWRVMWIAKGFSRWAKKAGIGCTFHDLRRTYGAWLVMAGADLVTVQQNMGHSDISVTVRHYAHMQLVHRSEQVDKLPMIGGMKM